MVSATSGDKRSRSRRFGSGRIGRSGKSEDTESGDIFSLEPAERPTSRDTVSHMAGGSRQQLRMRREGFDAQKDQSPTRRKGLGRKQINVQPMANGQNTGPQGGSGIQVQMQPYRPRRGGGWANMTDNQDRIEGRLCARVQPIVQVIFFFKAAKRKGPTHHIAKPISQVHQQPAASERPSTCLHEQTEHEATKKQLATAKTASGAGSHRVGSTISKSGLCRRWGFPLPSKHFSLLYLGKTTRLERLRETAGDDLQRKLKLALPNVLRPTQATDGFRLRCSRCCHAGGRAVGQGGAGISNNYLARGRVGVSRVGRREPSIHTR